MTEKEILDTLDNSNDGFYRSFVELGDVYSYLIDTRLNAFRGDNDRWATAVERLGYNPRAGVITLDIHYLGNCLTNLEVYNERPKSQYSVYPIDFESFNETMDGDSLRPAATHWLVRGQPVSLSHSKQDYTNAGIELKEYEPEEICAEEVGRLVVLQNRELFRATDMELYKSVPPDLKKILVIDEWFHKDFFLRVTPNISDEQLRQTFDINKKLTGLSGMSYEDFAEAFRQQQALNDDSDKETWENNRPGSYETWQLIAKAIAANDPTLYKPTLEANTHWKNWPDSGSM